MKPISFFDNKKYAKVLVVDDIADNYLLIQAILRDEGYQIIFASSGKEALEKTKAAPPDIILLDIMMPEIDGFEVTQQVCQNHDLPFIPILLITAYDQPSVARGLELGAIDFIRKPIEPDELVARVRSLLRLKSSIDEQEKVSRQREDFVSRLTHDLRTPLIASDRMLNLLLKNAFGEMPEAAQDILKTMIRSNQTLVELVNMLLEVYRYQAGRKPLALMPVNLPEMIQKVVKELNPLAMSKGLELETNLEQLSLPEEERITVVTGDYLELQRVVTNIVGNAIKFTDQGTIRIQLSSLSSLMQDKSSLRWALIKVEDTGPGIAAADQAAMFEGFRHGTHDQAGTGLGLTLSLHIVEAHKGKIEVESQIGQGSTFTIFLPEKQIDDSTVAPSYTV